MVGDGHILLNLMELCRGDLGQRVLLPVDNPLLQSRKNLLKTHGRGVGSQRSEQLDPRWALGNPELDPLQIRRGVDGSKVVGDLPEPIFPKPHNHQSLCPQDLIQLVTNRPC